jgi:hypothetical protein
MPELIIVDELVTITDATALTGTIDDPALLKTSRVWLYSGTKDTVVVPGVMKKLEKYYLHYMPSDGIQTEFTLASEHTIPTVDYGNVCDYSGFPYISKCDYEASSHLLDWIHKPDSSGPVTNTSSHTGEIIAFEQAEFLELIYTLYDASMDSTGYVYVPKVCGSGSTCKLHIAYHGCNQTLDDMGTMFVEHTGYLSWADANDMIVIFPQAIHNVLNPKGCWDWCVAVCLSCVLCVVCPPRWFGGV